jgi:hypothetical protein
VQHFPLAFGQDVQGTGSAQAGLGAGGELTAGAGLEDWFLSVTSRLGEEQ